LEISFQVSPALLQTADAPVHRSNDSGKYDSHKQNSSPRANRRWTCLVHACSHGHTKFRQSLIRSLRLPHTPNRGSYTLLDDRGRRFVYSSGSSIFLRLLRP
jgi:hypothetical protein